ncbi:hypothetical protein GTP46_19595 [Duganella sp. FT135W]|uniref:Uncharacterized protein n=1 Tax=Duganella flavida TaxID=2692175 RepID=A0A6L8KGA5_9BURK|nr:hypothetical protein [Duganella flavida]MYM24842.1 hypothetical protein [Duganella flavida]
MATTTDTNDAALNDLILTVKVIQSNYATKEELAILSGKIDAMPRQIELNLKTYIDQAFKAQTEMMYKVFATKAELANTLNQQTWRMAAFGSLLISAGFAFARYL